MGPRGWTQESIAERVGNPAETHSVWDYTTGSQQPATAYVRPDGSYVVVDDATGTVVQVSDGTNPNWKPVWNDPRFQGSAPTSRPLDNPRRLIDVCLRVGVPFWWQGPGPLLISGSELPAVLDALESAGQQVLGLEGFELESTAVHLRLDPTYDASIAARDGPAVVAAGWRKSGLT